MPSLYLDIRGPAYEIVQLEFGWLRERHSPSEESAVSEGFPPSVLEGGVRTNRTQLGRNSVIQYQPISTIG